MGITIPMFGLSSLDPTTPEWSPMVQFTYLFVALFMAVYAYTEIKGTMAKLLQEHEETRHMQIIL